MVITFGSRYDFSGVDHEGRQTFRIEGLVNQVLKRTTFFAFSILCSAFAVIHWYFSNIDVERKRGPLLQKNNIL